MAEVVKATDAVDVPDDLNWFRGDSVIQYDDMAPGKLTGQVNPYQFTTAMARLAEGKGARIVTGAIVEEIDYSSSDEPAVNAVRYRDKSTGISTMLAADIVILAAGPWTPTLFRSAPINALRAHSVTIKPSRPLSAYCLFTEISVPDSTQSSAHSATGKLVCPEIYSRPNNEVYIAGEGDMSVPLPSSVDEVEIDRNACRLVENAVMRISDELRDGVVTGRRACYLPTVDLPSGNPLIGPTDINGLILAAGHGCWGIHNAPATGKVISEIVFQGEAKSADISALDPRIVI
jgi:glycine/D-amino acid oxidase-like deaminating enzyme